MDRIIRRHAILDRAGLAIVMVLFCSTFLGVAAGAGASFAEEPVSDVACGDTITVDTTLQADLVGCPDNGLVVGADDITLDLNGHVIDGDGALQECPEHTACDLGVDNGGGHSGLRVVNGTVKDFNFGVLVGGAEDDLLARLTVVDNIASGIVVFDSTGVRIESSTIARNGLDTDYSGLGIFSSSHGVLAHDLVRDNGDIGLYAEDMHTYRVVGNTFSGNPEAGLSFNGTDNLLADNDVDRNGDGFAFAGDRNVLRGNHVTRSLGCSDGCGYGISFEGGSGNVLTWNLVSDVENGIRLDGFAGPAQDTIVSHNVVRRASRDDIVVNKEDAGPVRRTRLAANVAARAGDDGIDVNSASTRITANLAVRNHDLGIEAVAGVTGGANLATGNGDPRQCTHLAC